MPEFRVIRTETTTTKYILHIAADSDDKARMIASMGPINHVKTKEGVELISTETPSESMQVESRLIVCGLTYEEWKAQAQTGLSYTIGVLAYDDIPEELWASHYLDGLTPSKAVASELDKQLAALRFKHT